MLGKDLTSLGCNIYTGIPSIQATDHQSYRPRLHKNNMKSLDCNPYTGMPSIQATDLPRCGPRAEGSAEYYNNYREVWDVM